MTRQIFNIAAFKTASRCWLPANSKQAIFPATLRHFSSRQRCVNFNNVSEISFAANDTVMLSQEEAVPHSDVFEPTVFSSEEVHTPSPVNKA